MLYVFENYLIFYKKMQNFFQIYMWIKLQKIVNKELLKFSPIFDAFDILNLQNYFTQ